MDEAHESTGLMGLNGKTGEVLRWILGLVLAGIVAYFGAQSAIENRVAANEGAVQTIKATEQNHFEEIQRTLSRIEAEMIRLRDKK